MIAADGTAARDAPGSLPTGFVRLVASHRLQHPAADVAAAIEDGRLPWTRVPDPAPGLHRFALDLRVPLGSADRGLVTFRKAAYLDLGSITATTRGWSADIGWRASTFAPLFPVFAGRLTLESGSSRVDGIYAPPGGIVGRTADRALLHLAANRTARWVLAELDRIAA